MFLYVADTLENQDIQLNEVKSHFVGYDSFCWFFLYFSDVLVVIKCELNL